MYSGGSCYVTACGSVANAVIQLRNAASLQLLTARQLAHGLRSLHILASFADVAMQFALKGAQRTISSRRRLPVAAAAANGGGSKAPIIIWFKNDLRIEDHPGLLKAAGSGAPVVPLFVFDTDLYGSLAYLPGGAQGTISRAYV